MNAFGKTLLFSLLFAAATASARDINIRGTIIEHGLRRIYCFCKNTGEEAFNRLPDEIKAICESMEEGNFTFSEEELDAAAPHWRPFEGIRPGQQLSIRAPQVAA